MREAEALAWSVGHRLVGGVDEAGRGPLAGPVVAACVVLPDGPLPALEGLTDSKKLSAPARERYAALLPEVALAIGVGSASPAEIDALNILQATFLAMRRAVEAAGALDALLVDGNRTIPRLALPQTAIVKGDAKSLAIAAASVVAKVTRDRELVALDALHPGYDLARHKGYPTLAHREAVRRLGASPAHRLSFLGFLERTEGV